jgi:hypothetical protein
MVIYAYDSFYHSFTPFKNGLIFRHFTCKASYSVAIFKTLLQGPSLGW